MNQYAIEQHVGVNRNDSYVLYLHTKGVSVVNTSITTQHWRQYMTYFNVEMYKYCIRLFELHSVYDVLGVNLLKAKNNTAREQWHYSGNYWWARTRYTSTLPILSIHRNGKYDAELWIGSGPVPIYLVTLYNSAKNHYKDPIPRESYVNNWLNSGEFPILDNV